MTEYRSDLQYREQMFNFFKEGVLGTKEFRNWLAKNDESFASVRDPDVDNEIDDLARRRQESLKSKEDPIAAVDREGNEVA